MQQNARYIYDIANNQKILHSNKNSSKKKKKKKVALEINPLTTKDPNSEFRPPCYRHPSHSDLIYDTRYGQYYTVSIINILRLFRSYCPLWVAFALANDPLSQTQKKESKSRCLN